MRINFVRKLEILKMPKFHTRFTPPPSRGVHCCKPSLVQRQFMRDSDINYLVGRFTRTGSFYSAEQLARVRATPQFGDFVAMQTANVVEAHTTMVRAREAFEQLPFAVRERFGHSPEKLLAFVQDKNNTEEAIRLGLAVKAEPIEPIESVSPSVVPSTPKETNSQPAVS